jgi:ATP-dependent DNA ligase
LKIKARPQQEFMVCGFTEGKGSRKHIGRALMPFSLTEKERFNAMVQIAAGIVARDAARLTLRPLTRRVDLKETTSLTGLRIRS